MITTHRMQKIMTQITLGSEPKAENNEEKIFIEKVKLDIADIIKLGREVSIPSEFPEPI